MAFSGLCTTNKKMKKLSTLLKFCKDEMVLFIMLSSTFDLNFSYKII